MSKMVLEHWKKRWGIQTALLAKHPNYMSPAENETNLVQLT
jgi:hypothetical protein